ncbi:MAG TPA: flavodoxin family protein [Feifaniaceae bacterium]|nr:flavodoxin family protein [Feifaniaceae bacterium]
MNQVVYVSRGGNTKKLAESIARGAGTAAVPVERYAAQGSTDILYVGASIYAGSIDPKMREFLAGLNASEVKRVVVFGTSAGKKSALPEVKSILEPRGVAVSDDAFHCRGAFLLANRGRPSEEDLKQAETFAAGIGERRA